MEFKVGQIIKKSNGQKRKILGQAGEVFFTSIEDDFKRQGGAWTELELKDNGYTPEPEKWVPTKQSSYWFVKFDGEIDVDRWDGIPEELYLLKIGNCFETREKAEAYRQYLLDHPYKGE